jgi:hypothetical protein
MKPPRGLPDEGQGRVCERWDAGYELDASSSDAAIALDPGVPQRARVEPDRLLRALRMARARRLALTLESGGDAARSR